MTDFLLDDLYALIASRKGGDPEASYTAKMFARGRRKISQKVGEEAVELVIAALAEGKDKVISESADLLYHLLVLWAECEITPQDIVAELTRRAGTSGIDEKKSRKKS